MIEITFPDGAVKSYEKNVTPLDVASSISEGLARNVICSKVNGEPWDASRPIESNASLQLLTWSDDDGKSVMWHSTAHLMAEALESIYPGVKFGIGPSVENGFYYDIDLGDKVLSTDDFAAIEKKMIELAQQKNSYVRKEISKEDAIAYFKEKGDEYKLELLAD